MELYGTALKFTVKKRQVFLRPARQARRLAESLLDVRYKRKGKKSGRETDGGRRIARRRQKNVRGMRGMGKNESNSRKNRLAAGAVLLGAAGILETAARRIDGFAGWYVNAVYPFIVGSYGRFCGLFPFSLSEIALYGIMIYGMYSFVRIAISVVKAPLGAKGGKTGKEITSIFFFFSGLLAFLYVANCGVNYYAPPFSSYLGLEVRESSLEELKELCEYLTDKVCETEPKADAKKVEMGKEGRKAMMKLGETYPELSGFYPRPKPTAFSWILAVQQLCGVYSPFTVEANYNRGMTEYNIPLTVCHELSHLKGFMREDEANFIGYLACIGSDEIYFQYSGYLTGWVYAGNALARQDVESYMGLYEQLSQKAREDLAANNRYWNRYEGKVAEVSNQMNDTYLKMNSQADGVKSYGRVVDLMLAYRRDGKEFKVTIP